MFGYKLITGFHSKEICELLNIYHQSTLVLERNTIREEFNHFDDVPSVLKFENISCYFDHSR